MNLFVLNILIAAIWWSLSDEPDLASLIVGFVIGLILIIVFKPVFKDVPYIKKKFYRHTTWIRRTMGFIWYCFYFFKEFMVANITIAWAVITLPKNKIEPNLFTMDVSDLTTFEIIMLSQCITLTPGTITIKVSDDQKILFVHAFDAHDANQQRESIQNGLLKGILKFTR